MLRSVLSGVMLAALMLTGCSLGEENDSRDSIPDQPETSTVPESPRVDPEPGDTPGEERPPGISACDDDTKANIDTTIEAQTKAFRDGDFDAAYALASPRFQAGVTVDVFSTLIRLNYPELLTADTSQSRSCEVDSENGVATIVVRFETASDPAYTLRYVVELVEGQWRVSAATREIVADTIA